MEPNTLYYTFSTIPQITAAIAAVLAAFIFIRIQSIKDLLIGDGKSLFDRYERNEYRNYQFDKLEMDRLQDGINRRNICEIKSALEYCSDIESESGININNHPNGFQGIFRKFTSNEVIYNKIILFTKISLIISIMTILISTISLALVDFIIRYNGNSTIT